MNIKCNLILKNLLTATCFFLLLSCSNGDDTPVNDNPLEIPTTGSYMRATVDGQPFTSKVNGAEAVVALNQFGQILIVGTNVANQEITIALEGITSTGTYTINSDTDSILAFLEGEQSYDTKSGCSGAIGKVTITTIDETKIEGSFEFIGNQFDNCSASKTVTTGYFRGVYQN